MKTTVPSFVLRHNGSPSDWVETHDRLPSEGSSFAYQERNQEDWWKQNKQIRDLLTTTEQQVKSLIKTGAIPSVRLVSWLQLSRKLSCDRATLKHARRYHWVNAARVHLLKQIEDARAQAAAAQPAAPVISEVDQLKARLKQQRTQTAIWYEKCLHLEQQMDELNRVLAKREEKIKALMGCSSGDTHHK